MAAGAPRAARALLAGLLLALAGCAFVEEAVVPAVKGDFVPPQPPPQVASTTAAAAPAAVQPLLIIRFNQAVMEYETALQETLDQALAKQPAAVFDVVALAPAAGDAEANRKRARDHLLEVLQAMGAAGVDDGRIGASVLTSDRVQVDEVQIYIR